jgi:hypothetical protein
VSPDKTIKTNRDAKHAAAARDGRHTKATAETAPYAPAMSDVPPRDVAYLCGRALAGRNPTDAQVETITKGSPYPKEFRQGYLDGLDEMTEGGAT